MYIKVSTISYLQNCKRCKGFLIRWFKKNLLTRKETDRLPRRRIQHRKPLRQLNISKKR